MQINFKSSHRALFVAGFWPRVSETSLPGKYLRLHSDVNTESICRVNINSALQESHKSQTRELFLVNQQA